MQGYEILTQIINIEIVIQFNTYMIQKKRAKNMNAPPRICGKITYSVARRKSACNRPVLVYYCQWYKQCFFHRRTNMDFERKFINLIFSMFLNAVLLENLWFLHLLLLFRSCTLKLQNHASYYSFHSSWRFELTIFVHQFLLQFLLSNLIHYHTDKRKLLVELRRKSCSCQIGCKSCHNSSHCNQIGSSSYLSWSSSY